MTILKSTGILLSAICLAGAPVSASLTKTTPLSVPTRSHAPAEQEASTSKADSLAEDTSAFALLAVLLFLACRGVRRNNGATVRAS